MWKMEEQTHRASEEPLHQLLAFLLPPLTDREEASSRARERTVFPCLFKTMTHLAEWLSEINHKVNMSVTQSSPTLCDSLDYSPPGSSPGKNGGVDFHSLLQGIFLTQGSNQGLLHCRQILYSLNHASFPTSLYFIYSLLFYYRTELPGKPKS